MTEPLRKALPNRRWGIVEELKFGERVVTATIGFDPADRRPAELFLSGEKDGSDMGAILDDVSVVISIALQHGISAATLAKSIARIPVRPMKPRDLDAPAMAVPEDRPAASIIGAALDLLVEQEKGVAR